MIEGFAIIPDETERPAAFFKELEDAMDWGVATFGDDAFRIRFVRLEPIELPADDAA